MTSRHQNSPTARGRLTLAVRRAFLLLVLSLVGLSGIAALAQAPSVPIETQHPLLQDEAILAKAAKLREAGQLMDGKRVEEQIKNPQPATIDLLEPATTPLRGREIAARARTAYLRLGWYYLCPRCEHWHLNFAGAYPIGHDMIATCHHCIVPKSDIREGYLIVVDHEGTVLPVSTVLARSQAMDVAILRIADAKFTPLALQDNVAPGDAAYCFSEPLGQLGYFTTGIVNRFYRKPIARSSTETVDDLKPLRMNVSTDWAPGSSGAAVLDECGNVIGHVATISPLAENKRPDPSSPGDKSPETTPSPGNSSVRDRSASNVLITLHEAIPARLVRALAKGATEVSHSKL